LIITSIVTTYPNVNCSANFIAILHAFVSFLTFALSYYRIVCSLIGVNRWNTLTLMMHTSNENKVSILNA